MRLLDFFLLYGCSSLLAAGTAALADADIGVFKQNGVNISTYDSNYWLFEHNGIPNHAYGPFPSPHNPNSVIEQTNEFYIPKTPVPLAQPMCLGMGPIGVAISGIPLFNPYSNDGYDAVGGIVGSGQCAEVFDSCQGHPQITGMYHYHQISYCLYNGTENKLLGVALDGHPVYGPLIENGVTVTRKSGILDVCGGRMYNGQYRYHMTYDFPYTLGCYHSQIHPRHHPTRVRRHISQIHKREGNTQQRNCMRNGNPESWLPCYANCENPVLGCHNQTSSIIG